MGISSPVREGSVTFSLLELGRLEAERVKEEREAALAAGRAEEQARAAEAYRLAQAKEEETRRVADERRRGEERAREEVARLEAIRAAEVERARVQAEREAAAAAREREYQRDIELTTLADRAVAKRLRHVVVAQGIVLAVVVLGGALGYGVLLAPEAERRVAAAGAEVVERDKTIVDLRGELTERTQELAQARRQDASSAGDVAALTVEIARLKSERDARGKEHHAAPPPAPTLRQDVGLIAHCDPGSRDPLCASLAH